VSDRGALPELVVDGEGGLVGRADDAGQLGRHLRELLADAALRERFGRFNRERIDRHFRWDRAARRVCEIYEDVLAEWKRGVQRG